MSKWTRMESGAAASEDDAVEEGPLSDGSGSQADDDDDAARGDEATGLPSRYLEAPAEAEGRDFKALEPDDEDTASEASIPAAAAARRDLRLDLNLAGGDQPSAAEGGGSGIIFSPGGSEAYVFTSSSAAAAEGGGQEEARRKKESPREIDDAVFLEHVQRAAAAGEGSARGERPATVGGQGPAASRALPLPPLAPAASSPANKKKRDPRRALQDRLEDLKITLDQEVGGTTSSALSSTADESSPRFPPVMDGRRALPRVPVSRDQFLQDPDGFHLNVSDLEVSSADASGLASPVVVVPGLPLAAAASDRAHSPSSVVSAASSTASGMLSGRKHLEWDSGADLGYLGDPLPRTEASLSTLEKMAIGNYSGLLRTEPEGKSAKGRGGAAGGARPSAMSRALDARQRTEEEMRQTRMHKFADSLMRQRELRRMAAAAAGEAKGPAASPGGRRRRSKSRESAASSSGRRRSSPSSMSEASPSHQQQQRHRRQQHQERRHRRRYYGSPMKSSSLTDLHSEGAGGSADFKMRPSYSNYEVSALWVTGGGLAGGSSEPSSHSSTATVVPIVQTSGREVVDPCAIQAISTDPESLPANLQGIFQGTVAAGAAAAAIHHVPDDLQTRASQASLVSRRSGSRSFETVINLDNQRSGGSRATAKRYSTRDNLNSDSAEGNTEEEVEAGGSRGSYFGRAEGNGGADRPVAKAAWPGHQQPSHQQMLLSAAARRRREASRTSSAVTTSDDERNGHDVEGPGGGRRRRGAGAGLAPVAPATTASSTMESAQIDRAKSFEYFPGESFPMQENSSSYEYLPGHLVSDRPGTVVSNYRNDEDEEDAYGADGGGGVSGVTSMSVSDSTSSDAAGAAAVKSKKRNSNPAAAAAVGARRRIDLDRALLGDDLRHVADELNDRSRELLRAHVRRTRHFYRRVKEDLAFVSAPASTAEDARRKQEVLAGLLRMMEGGGEDQEAVGNESDRNSEATTRQIQTETDGRQAAADGDRTDVSTSTNGEEPTKAVSSASAAALKKKQKKSASAKEEVGMQQKRVDQLRVLRKEMRKLEQLEASHLEQLMQKAGQSAETDDSVASSAKTASSGGAKRQQGGVKKVGPAKTTSKLGVDPKFHPPKKEAAPRKPPVAASSTGAHGAAPGTRPKSRESVVRKTTLVGSVTRTKTHLIVAGEPPRPASGGNRAGGGGQPSTSTSTSTSSSSSAAAVRSRAEFGQTYPTPREDEQQPRKAKKATKGVQTNGQRATDGSKKPVAYYLPLGGRSVVRIGSKAVREDPEERVLSKENRSILANYVAGLESGSRPIKRDAHARHAAEEEEDRDNGRRDGRNLTLRDALAARRPGFVEEAERRREHLVRMRLQRLEHEEARRRWAERVGELSPRSRRRGGAAAPSPPPPARVTRLFSHREMVEATRRRYLRLPEVAGRKREARRASHDRANRVFREVYNRRLQQGVLRGRVSLAHHRQVIDYY